MLNIYRKVIAKFLIIDKANKLEFIKEIFLLANLNSEIVFEMLFLTLNGANIDFLD